MAQSLPVQASPQGPPPPLKKPGAADGFRALFSGFGFVIGRPGNWLLSFIPLAVALILLGLFCYAAFRLVPGQIDHLFAAKRGTWAGIAATALKIIATALSLLVAALAAFGLAQPLSGPALERIVRRAEAHLGVAPWPKTSLLEDILRSLQGVLVGYALALPLLALLFFIDFIFPPAAVVTFPLKLVVTALMIAWDLCDYPLSIRGLRIGHRLWLLGRHFMAVLGFGAALSLLSLLPCALLLVLPAGVAGAAHLIWKIENYEKALREESSKSSEKMRAIT